MSLRQKYLKILSDLAPAGAVGVSLVLGSAAPSMASDQPASQQPAASQGDRVSERLAAIRQAVSAIAAPESQANGAGKGDTQLAWGNWWHPYGYGYGWPNWNNWHNWNNWGNWFRNW